MTLQEFFQQNPEVAIAFSGGVDSAYLLYEACRHTKRVRAYYVQSEFQPQFELDDARKLADELKADMKILHVSALSIPEVKANPKNRCYYCKQAIFGTIKKAAAEDGFTVLLDGTNASDDEGDRPGMQALRELKVKSPLRDCGLTKDEIRKRSKEAGLFTWDKPAYACLATRIPAGEELTQEKLTATEKAEMYLFSMGFKDIRVRSDDGHARIQVPKEQIADLIKNREEIRNELKQYYKTVSLDLEARS